MNQPRSSPLFRAAPYLALAVLGFALVVANHVPQAPGPRLGRRANLVDLIRAEDRRVRELRGRVDQLAADLARLRRSSSGREGEIGALRALLDRLAPLAGLTEVTGPGVAVDLRDSTLRESPTGDPNDLVIHEQDLQAVVNGLWAAGAEAIAVNGERITALSAIRCVGNTLLLHGSVHSPPYRIRAIGPPARMRRAVESDPLVERVRVVAEQFQLGFAVREVRSMRLPAYRGVLAARFARRA